MAFEDPPENDLREYEFWKETHTCEGCGEVAEDICARPELGYQLLCNECCEYMKDCRRERDGCYISEGQWR